MRLALELAYDGTNYCGWQIQPGQVTVQLVLEEALAKICGHPVPILGSGRTDTGVHALTQYASLDFTRDMTLEQIKLAISSLLPHDIQVRHVWLVKPDFNARFDALMRSYVYKATYERTPFNRLYKGWFRRRRIVLPAMTACLPYFLGEKDFTSFAKFNPKLKHHRCTVYAISLQPTAEGFDLHISANRFLHNMVRRLVGTMVHMGYNNIPPNQLKIMLEACQARQKNIYTAPPQGLYLSGVLYPPGNLLEHE